MQSHTTRFTKQPSSVAKQHGIVFQLENAQLSRLRKELRIPVLLVILHLVSGTVLVSLKVSIVSLKTVIK